MTFAEWFHRAVNERWPNFTKAAEAMGLTPSMVHNYVRGKSYPNTLTIKKIAAALDVAPEEVWRKIPGHAVAAPQKVLTGGLANCEPLVRLLQYTTHVAEILVRLDPDEAAALIESLEAHEVATVRQFGPVRGSSRFGARRTAPDLPHSGSVSAAEEV